MRFARPLALSLLVALVACHGAEEPVVQPASEEAKAAISSFQLAPGFRAELVAAEPQVANPVAFHIRGDGSFLVAETFRQETEGVPDNRTHPEWLDDDLRAKTVQDRRQTYLKHHPSLEREWTRFEDRLRLVRDTDGDGRADDARVFAGGFRDLLDGTGAGVLQHGEDVYYTCIPNLWRLRDLDGDGEAESRDVLSTGYGVRVALRGHDLHGLTLGFDGRLYFSVGDRGYAIVTSDGRELQDPESGAVFRCELDGSGLEVFATGLRNPQELAFDDEGNLFSVDNNSDSEDQARVVQIVRGGETGWRMNFQYLPRRGPWVEEGWWKPRFEGQASFLIPPIANLGNGPSGLVFDPGIGLPDRLRGTFLLCDFLGGRSSSGLRVFSLEPDGAGFRLGLSEHLLKGLLPTDVDFGPDGALYVLDWVEGWVGVGKGRIYRLKHESSIDDPRRAEAASWHRLPASELKDSDLFALLGHDDRRLRLKAQYEAARRGAPLYGKLRDLADRAKSLLVRRHAFLALSQAARKDKDAAQGLLRFLSDDDAFLRRHAIELHSGLLDVRALPLVLQALNDQAPSVQLAAALALGHFGDATCLPNVRARVRELADRDAVLVHGLVMALQRIASREELEAWATEPEPALRRAAVLALRRQRSPGVTRFLGDADPGIAAEAALAIYDVPIREAFPALVDSAKSTRVIDPAHALRALFALEQEGGVSAATGLLELAGRSSLDAAVRAQALDLVPKLVMARERDLWLNVVRAREGTPLPGLRATAAPALLSFLSDPQGQVASAAARTLASLEHVEAAPSLRGLLSKADAPPAARAEALEALLHFQDAPTLREFGRFLEDPVALLRRRAADLLVKVPAEDAISHLTRLLQSPSVGERQAALRALAHFDDAASSEIARRWLLAQRERNEPLPAALRLEVAGLLSARKEVKDVGVPLLPTGAKLPSGRKPEPYQPFVLEGGDAEAGRRLFLEKREISCLRCHDLEPPSHGPSTKAGPVLAGISSRRDHIYLLESIVSPNRALAEGYHMVTLETESEGWLSGRVLQESDTELHLEDLSSGRPERLIIPKSQILHRRSDPSAMPEDLIDHLPPSDLRDLLAFLSSL